MQSNKLLGSGSMSSSTKQCGYGNPQSKQMYLLLESNTQLNDTRTEQKHVSKNETTVALITDIGKFLGCVGCPRCGKSFDNGKADRRHIREVKNCGSKECYPPIPYLYRPQTMLCTVSWRSTVYHTGRMIEFYPILWCSITNRFWSQSQSLYALVQVQLRMELLANKPKFCGSRMEDGRTPGRFKGETKTTKTN
jgi:hypothetical protein